MSLGKTISRLRAERELSQDDLAAALGVSRQSVSKWETDSSVPELDKLVKLSQLFGVSLDELVLDRPASPDIAPGPAPAAEPAAPAQPLSRLQKLVGVLLLFFGGLVALALLFLFGHFLVGLPFALPLLLCGAVCLLFRRHVGLWCAWAVFFSVYGYFRYATMISWEDVFMVSLYQSSWNYTWLVIAWVEFLVVLLLIVLTAVLLRKTPFPFTRRNLALLLAGWVLFFAVPCLDAPLFLALPPYDYSSNHALGRSIYFFLSSALKDLRLILLTVLATCLVRGLRGLLLARKRS